jgi:cytosine/adenosine deaminase-related metal-dependent hydrolase
MFPSWRSPVAFVNARVITEYGEARTIRFGRRVLDLDGAAKPGDVVVDLGGRIVLPGLINAHDHLELNHYGPLKTRPRYQNAGEWIADLEPVVRGDPDVVARSRIPLRDRLLVGGIKNLLAGVTTVAHHNPVYRAIGRRFPVSVLRRFGWAHSLGLESGPAGAHGEPGGSVAQRYASTPHDAPFIVHAAEGVDGAAADDIEALESRACLSANTVLVHGVAVTPSRWATLFDRGVSLVWCPASNLFLFGRTLRILDVLSNAAAATRVCLGTDSRLTGSRDLLDELRVAAEAGVAPLDLLRMVTTAPAGILRLQQAGRIDVGGAADLLVIPNGTRSAAAALLRCTRADVNLVVHQGRPRVGTPDMLPVFAARQVATRRIRVDESPRVADARIARRLQRNAVQEPGVEVV